MKIYTVLETRFEHKPILDYISCLDSWSESYSSEENALKGFKSMVRKAVKEFFTRHQENGDIEAIVATIISRVVNGNEAFAAWENKDESYIWKILSEYVDNQMDPLPARSENKDEPVKPVELVRYAVVRTKSGHKWQSPYPAGKILFTAETEERARKLLKEVYYDCLLMYPELRESDHYISEHGGFAFAGDPKIFGVELHIQELTMPLTDKEIADTADYRYHSFTQLKPTGEEQNGGDKVRE